jgi:hypothetical protein
MHARPTAQPCRCEYPLRDRDTCLYCGRSVPVAPESRNSNDRTTPGNPWTRAGVLRALRAFAFFRGRPPIADDWSHRMAPDWPPLTVVERLFGSLPDALGAADIDRPSRTG